MATEAFLKNYHINIDDLKDMVVLIGDDYKIRAANRAFVEKLGCAKRDVVGKYCYKLAHKMKTVCRLPHGICPMKEVIKRGESVNKVHAHFDKAGNKFYADISVSPLKNEKGKIIGIIEVARDITSQKELDSLRSEFISFISHQLLSPLGTMSWELELLKRNLPSKLLPKFREIYSLNVHAIKLILDLVNVVRIESGKFGEQKKKVDLAKLLEKIISEKLSSFAISGDRANIRFTGPKKGMAKINIDASALKEIFNNLIDNAVKYSLPNSPVNVSLRSSGKNILFKCEDYGFGIPQKERKNIFSKFFRCTNARKKGIKGTGLGLYVAALLVKKLGGKIWFNAKKRGTIFYVLIPKMF